MGRRPPSGFAFTGRGHVTGRRNSADLPVERPFNLYVNERELVTVMASPENLEELAVGWLWVNDLISRTSKIKRIMVDVPRGIIWTEIDGDLPPTFKRTVSSGCGGGVLIADILASPAHIKSTITISTAALSALMDDFFNRSTIYKRTGGVHGAAIATSIDIEYVAEDIGRHNAVDKVIGWALLGGIALAGKIILTTGRISSDMMMKAAKAGFPIVASRTAATDLAVDLAAGAGITVAGYVRKEAAVVYTHPERIAD